MGRHMLYVGNVPAGNLTSTIPSAGTGTFTVAAWPSLGGAGQPFVVEVGAGLGDDEKILCTQGTASGGTCTLTIDAAGRGWDGTTPAQHDPGEIVRNVPDATSAQDANDHVYTVGRDDHTQYLNVARHDITGRHGPTVVIHANAGLLSADDHTQYYNQARHDAHLHPATAFATAPGVITRAMLGGAAQGLMVGQVIHRAGGISAGESSYLLPADGSAVSRTAWPALFAQIGILYGAGDGTTTFNVPNVADRVLLGASVGVPSWGGTARPEASTGGAETHALVAAELAAHVHTVVDNGHTHALTDPHHNHGAVSSTVGLVVSTDNAQTIGLTNTNVASKAGGESSPHFFTDAVATGVTAATGHAAFTGGNTGTVGTGTAFGILPPFVAIPAFIVAA